MQDEVIDQEQLEDFQQRVLSSKRPIITEEVLNIILEESNKEGILTLDHKINGTKSTKTFRGSISIYLNRSWIDKTSPVTTSKWAWVPRKPGSTKLKRVSMNETKHFEERPVSFRRKLMTIHETSVVGQFDIEEWKNVVARFSTAYMLLESYINELQKHKMVELKSGSSEITALLESNGYPTPSEERSLYEGPGEVVSQVEGNEDDKEKAE